MIITRRPQNEGMNGGLLFDGFDDHIGIDMDAMQDNDFTLLTKVITSTDDAEPHTIYADYHYSPRNTGITLRVFHNKFVFTTVENGSYQHIFASRVISSGESYHITLVRKNNEIKLFINGEQEVNLMTSRSFAKRVQTIGALKVFDHYEQHFQGIIEHIALVKTAMFTTNFNPTGIDYNQLPNAQVVLLFSEKIGNIAHDISGNANHGTLYHFNHNINSGWIN